MGVTAPVLLFKRLNKMADITKCSGEGCPLKTKCYRHTAKDSEMQSWFLEPPYKTDNKRVVSCDMFWGEASRQLMNRLESIVKGDLNK